MYILNVTDGVTSVESRLRQKKIYALIGLHLRGRCKQMLYARVVGSFCSRCCGVADGCNNDRKTNLVLVVCTSVAFRLVDSYYSTKQYNAASECNRSLCLNGQSYIA